MLNNFFHAFNIYIYNIYIYICVIKLQLRGDVNRAFIGRSGSGLSSLA